MAEARLHAAGLSRAFQTRTRRAGLSGAVVDWISPIHTERVVIEGVDLDVRAGQVVGLLGANGAGKSTVVKCLVGLLQPTSGTVRIDGLDPFAQREQVVRRLGVVFGQRSQLWWDLAVRESFDLLAALFGVDDTTHRARLESLVAALEIEDLLARPVRELSLGQRVRCDLAASLLHGPSVLVLDEPTIGIDASVRTRVRSFVRARADGGAAVLLATHDLDDVDAICDAVVLLDHGRPIFQGPPAALKTWLGGVRSLRVVPRAHVSDEAVAALSARLGVAVAREGGALRVPIDVDAAVRTRVVLDAIDVMDVATVEASLERLLADWYEAHR